MSTGGNVTSIGALLEGRLGRVSLQQGESTIGGVMNTHEPGGDQAVGAVATPCQAEVVVPQLVDVRKAIFSVAVKIIVGDVGFGIVSAALELLRAATKRLVLGECEPPRQAARVSEAIPDRSGPELTRSLSPRSRAVQAAWSLFPDMTRGSRPAGQPDTSVPHAHRRCGRVWADLRGSRERTKPAGQVPCGPPPTNPANDGADPRAHPPEKNGAPRRGSRREHRSLPVRAHSAAMPSAAPAGSSGNKTSSGQRERLAGRHPPGSGRRGGPRHFVDLLAIRARRCALPLDLDVVVRSFLGQLRQRVGLRRHRHRFHGPMLALGNPPQSLLRPCFRVISRTRMGARFLGA